MSVTESHKIIYLGKALRYLFSADPQAFGSIDPRDYLEGNEGEVLIEQLPLLKQGYASFKTVMALLEIYQYLNKENVTFGTVFTFLKPGKLMIAAFGSSIPATFYCKGKKKIPMDEAVRQGLIQSPLNTFDDISNCDPDFDRYEFVSIDFPRLINLNSYNEDYLKTRPKLQPILDTLRSQNVREQAAREDALVRSVLMQWVYGRQVN